MKISLFLLFILFIRPVQGTEPLEVLDVEKLPYYRTQQYPLKEYSKIVVFSASRTGSTLVYNVMRFLFEDSAKLSEKHNKFSTDRRILKTHGFNKLNLLKEKKVFHLFTLRNPRDACASGYRIRSLPPEKHQEHAKMAVATQYKYLNYSEMLVQKGARVERLRYEDFAENLDFLFTFIESHFSIDIDPRDKEMMRRGYSKENVHACIQKFLIFKEYLPISGFHGKHISMGENRPPESFFYWLNIYLEEIKPAFAKYGYQF